MLSFMMVFTVTYLYASEKVQARPKGEKLQFLHRQSATIASVQPAKDVEAGSESPMLSVKSGIQMPCPPSGAERVTTSASLVWSDVTYTLRLKKKERRILDGIDGYVVPGTMTALMVSLLCLT